MSTLAIAATAGAAQAEDVSLATFRNNVGITQDPLSNADFDAGGYSYSALALRHAGLVAGEPVTVAGMTYTWPATASGAADNVATRGQEVPVVAPTGAKRLGFLGASTTGPVSGDFLLHYEYVDGEGITRTTTVPTRLTFSDWTLNAGRSTPNVNNRVVATTAFRLQNSLVPQVVNTHVFAIAVNLDPSKTLTSITLPDTAGTIHLFAMSVAS